MKLHWTVKAAAVLAILAVAPAAFAEWELNWYADADVGVGNLILQSDGITPVPEGGAVYLIYSADGVADGIDPNTGALLGGDQIVMLDGGGLARVAVGDYDQLPFNPQGPGEFNAGIQTISDATPNDGTGMLYAIAFQNWVAYGGGVFVGFSPFGISGSTYTTTGAAAGQFWDAGNAAWQMNNQLIPEPATVAMMVAGIGGMMAYRRKRKSQA